MKNPKIQYEKEEYWKNYMINWFGKELIIEWEKNSEIHSIPSGTNSLNVEVFSQEKKEKNKAPVIIFLHGIAGYARILLPFTIRLFQAGYTIIAPDLKGYGYTPGRKGSFSWDEHIQNILDIVDYAYSQFKGPIFLAGASLGGPLAYAASCKTDKIKGVICWCLWDLQDPGFLSNQTNLGMLALRWKKVFKFLGKIFAFIRIPTSWVISYKTLSNPDIDLYKLILKDPQAGRKITLKGANSLLFKSSPLKSFQNFKKSILICHPQKDLMVSPKFSKKIFDLIAKNQDNGQIVEYYEISNCYHFPIESEPYMAFTKLVQNFIKQVLRGE